MNISKIFYSVTLLNVFICFSYTCYSQAEVKGWGNIVGIRVDGQLMEFETSIIVLSADTSKMRQTAKERQLPNYNRLGNKQIIKSRLDSITFIETVEDINKGSIKVSLQTTSTIDTTLMGVYFCIDVPGKFYSGGELQLDSQEKIKLLATNLKGENVYLNADGREINLISNDRQLNIQSQNKIPVHVRDNQTHNDHFQIYFMLMPGKVNKGETITNNFTITASGKTDQSPVTLALDTSKPGRRFAGLGGNFRLQNEKTDPPVIDYCLENLRVAWGRVEMPWRFWQPDENISPLEEANKGNIHPRVKAAMEMAQRLYQMGIPVILSAWSGPDWAIEGEMRWRPRPDGQWGNALREDQMDKIYASITNYILYLKQHYGVEVSMFSFNESDLGINIRQTPEEHVKLIKGLGAYFASKGLKTKLLLGDTADANGHPFIVMAMNDPSTHPYLGAVSFHSWRGWNVETLNTWGQAAKKLNLPLLVGEGSIDAAAWRYPIIFEEPLYAREEINLYVRILQICQPESILQWQLTADYSPLSGGGVFGNNSKPLYPTQRFFNLKQLAASPEGAFAMPITSNKEDISCAALGDNTKQVYTIHLVNNGSTRQATITGLPKAVKQLQLYITDSKRSMQKGPIVNVTKGHAQFTLDAVAFTTLNSLK